MKKLTIFDGGMGRELERIGAPFSQPLWSAQALIESPDDVRKVHQSFIDAGADIITANSYACVPFHLGDELYKKNGALLARQAAVLAQSVARHRDVKVAGSIPPALGSYRPDLFEVSQATAIITTLFQAQDPYVDLWLVETLSSLQEFETVHAVLKYAHQDSYYSFSLRDDPQDRAKLRSGEDVSLAVTRVCLAGAQGIFFNCSIPEVMEQAIVDAKEVMDRYDSDVKVGVYANNFIPIPTDCQANRTLSSMRSLSPEDYLTFAKRWYDLGATSIGGCCGIGPDHIRTLAQWRNTIEKS